MKKILLPIIFLLTGFIGLNAQSLEFDASEVSISGSYNAPIIDLKNNLNAVDGSKALSLNWMFTTHDFPETWTFALCVGDICTPSQTSTNPESILPGTPLDVKIQFKPNGSMGSGYVILSFNDVVDPSISASAMFMATADEATGITLTPVEPKFNFYPNPVTDVMNLEFENYPQIAKVGIYSLIGKEVKSFSTSEELQIIDTSDLIQGMYLITLEDQNGKLVETRRFSKVY